MEQLLVFRGAVISALMYLVVSTSQLRADQMTLSITAGSAVFESPTNVSGIEVKGKSTALNGHVDLQPGGDGLSIQNIEAHVPTNTLLTGMKVRDQHMRKYIFTTENQQEPDIIFLADKASCPGTQSSKDFTCDISGTLSLRGLKRPFQITLKVNEQGGPSRSFHAVGEGLVKLSSYGIEPPSQFGVKSSDQVKLHFDFTAKSQASVASVDRDGK